MKSRKISFSTWNGIFTHILRHTFCLVEFVGQLIFANWILIFFSPIFCDTYEEMYAKVYYCIPLFFFQRKKACLKMLIKFVEQKAKRKRNLDINRFTRIDILFLGVEISEMFCFFAHACIYTRRFSWENVSIKIERDYVYYLSMNQKKNVYADFPPLSQKRFLIKAK
jgi:hypothetical protein